MKYFSLKKIFLVISAFILFTLTLSSCFNDMFDFDNIAKSEWTSEWAVPMVHSKLGLEDLVKDSNNILISGEDGLLKLVYETDRMLSVYARDLIDIPDQNKTIEKDYSLPEMNQGEIKVIPVDLSFDFETEKPEQIIDSILLKNGLLELHVQTDLNKDEASILIKLPCLVHVTSRDTLAMTFDAGYQGGLITRDTSLSLADYIILPEKISKTENKMDITAYITVTGDNNPDLSPYSLELELYMKELGFSRFFGYLGQYSYELSDSIGFDFFNINQVGNFVFEQGSIEFEAWSGNSYGMPIRVNLTEFRAHADGNPPVVSNIYLNNPGQPDIIYLNYPTYNQIGLVTLTEINTGNSNIHEAVNIYPDRISIKAEGLSNPEGNTGALNFVLDTSRFDMKMNLGMNLFGSMENFTVIDTVEFEFPDLDDVEECLFRVITTNSFPLNARLEISFVDSTYYWLGDLLAEPTDIITAPPVGPAPEYRVINPSVKTNEIILQKSLIEAVKDTRYFIIRAYLDTSGNDVVKIYDDSDIDVKIGLKVKLKL